MTNSEGYRDSAVITSSAIPSETNSCAGSPLIFERQHSDRWLVGLGSGTRAMHW
jgi:hypothetical protein